MATLTYNPNEQAEGELNAEEQEEILNQRITSRQLPKTTVEEIKLKSVSWFGEGEELPYVEYGEEGLKERKLLVSLQEKIFKKLN